MYIAKKPCRFCGHQFFIGQEIPDEFVDASRSESLVKMGLIEYLPVNAAKTPNNPPEDDGRGNLGGENEQPESVPETQENEQPESVPEMPAAEPAKPTAGKKGTGKKTSGKAAAKK